jgi:hypothetical protein
MVYVIAIIATWGLLLLSRPNIDWSTQSIVTFGLFTSAALAVTAVYQKSRSRTRLDELRTQYLASPITEIASFRRSQPSILREFARVRRYQRILTVMVLHLKPNQDLPRKLSQNEQESTPEALIKSSKKNYELLEFLIVGAILRDSLRESEITTYDARNNQFVIILPEVNKAQTMNLVERLKGLLYDKVLAQIKVGIAEYPNDGLVIEDLVKFAVKHSKPMPMTHNTKTILLSKSLQHLQVEVY